MVMINLMAAARKHNVETECHTQKTLPGKNNSLHVHSNCTGFKLMLITVFDDCVILPFFLSYLPLSSSCTQQLGPAEGFFLLGAVFLASVACFGSGSGFLSCV